MPVFPSIPIYMEEGFMEKNYGGTEQKRNRLFTYMALSSPLLDECEWFIPWYDNDSFTND